jgi:hypothetical protein
VVADPHLGSATAELHTTITDIESMREMAVLTPCNPDSHWHDRFGSLRLSFGYTRSRHVMRLFRVAFVPILVFAAVMFVFVLFFFVFGLFPHANVGG